MNDTRKAQLVSMTILDEIVRICDKHNLKYFLMYGTLLGAVRHQGFIPWDDDIDIAMPEEDYDAFLGHAKEELDEKYFLHNNEVDPNYFPDFSRIRRNDTVYLPDVYAKTKFMHNGLWIDVFPLHYAKSNESYGEKIKYVLQRKVFRPMAALTQLEPKKNTAIKMLCVSLIRRIKLSTILRWNEKVARSCDGEGAKYYVCENVGINMKKDYYPIEWFGNGIFTSFEDKVYRVPENADKVLTQMYGDYMKLPPENERIGHVPREFDVSRVSIENE